MKWFYDDKENAVVLNGNPKQEGIIEIEYQTEEYKKKISGKTYLTKKSYKLPEVPVKIIDVYVN